MKQVIYIFAIASLTLASVCTAMAGVPPTRGGNAVTVPTPPTNNYPFHDYVPTVMKDGSLYKMWWCGGPGDIIYYSESTSLTSGWSGPIQVFWASAPGNFDSGLVCDPSVV